jgi:tetratricopeptide (TPR) repeat protein
MHRVDFARASLISLVASAALAAEPGALTDSQLKFAVTTLFAKYESRTRTTVDDCRPVIAASGFKKLPADDRRSVMAICVMTASADKQYDEGLAWARLGSHAPDANYRDWAIRMAAAWYAKDKRDAAASLTTAARRWPAEATEFDDEVTGSVAFYASESDIGLDARIKLLDALFAAGWTWKDRRPEELWHELVWSLGSSGRMERARQVFPELTTPRLVIGFWIDKRFDAVTDAHQKPLDMSALTARYLARSIVHMRAQPRSLETLGATCLAYITAGEYEEARTLAKETLSRRASFGKDFDDPRATDRIDECARLVPRRLGEWPAAEEQYSRDIEAPPSRSTPFSTLYALAEFYVATGDTKRAGPLLERLSAVEMNATETRNFHYLLHAARKLQGDAAGAKSELAWLREHRQETEWVYMSALLEENDLDAAAPILIRHLQDPAERGDTLYIIQKFRVAAETPRDKRWREGLQALTARADVRATIDVVGRVGTFDVPKE